eukprot:COSAG01_NODE_55643_length_323_cov_1.924107_1_plen_55_part_01
MPLYNKSRRIGVDPYKSTLAHSHELRVTAWVMRRKRRDKEQAEEMSGGYFHRHES